jgi:hypothetical protein
VGADTCSTSGATQQHIATEAFSAALPGTGLSHQSGRNECPPPFLYYQQQVPSHPAQAPNANISSLNDMFKEVAMIFLQIMTEINGTESEEEKQWPSHKFVLKLMKKMTGRFRLCR